MRAALLFACAAPAAANLCNPAGMQRTEALCAPGRKPQRCAKRLVYMQRDCKAREEELALRGEADPSLKEELDRVRDFRQSVQQLDARTEDYKAGRGDEPAAPGAPGRSPQLSEAQEALSAGDHDAAEAAASQAIAANPSDPAAWTARMQARSLKGDKAGSRADAKQVLALEPTPEQGAAATGMLGAEGLAEAQDRVRGQKLEFQDRAPSLLPGAGARKTPLLREERPRPFQTRPENEPRAALDARALAAQAAAVPKAAGGPKNEAESRALAKLRVRDFSGAYDESSKAIAERDGARARTLRAAAANRLGRHEQAIADADAALAFEPKDVSALLERGYAKYKLGRYSDALGDVDEALAIDPLNAMGYLYRGMILEKLSRLGEAVSSYMKAGELDEGLKPVADEHLARLEGRPSAAAPRAGWPGLVDKAAKRWKLWLALLAAAAFLLARGLRRAVKPEWATPAAPGTPLTPSR